MNPLYIFLIVLAAVSLASPFVFARKEHPSARMGVSLLVFIFSAFLISVGAGVGKSARNNCPQLNDWMLGLYRSEPYRVVGVVPLPRRVDLAEASASAEEKESKSHLLIVTDTRKDYRCVTSSDSAIAVSGTIFYLDGSEAKTLK